MKQTQWYKDRVFYQIWPRSFKDGNDDGMGDLWGVLDKLDYIKSLGCDGIWFSPLYPSGGADCGYDISDYMDIDPMFGGMEAFQQVLKAAHERNIRVIMDLVINHTSDEHPWFQKSRQRIAPYTDYYIWRPEKPNGKLPNNWDSNFEGSAWTWDTVRQEYYLHLFAIKQPDLNMDNPLVREEVKKIMEFWLSMGVDGFREDVITYISKKEGLPDDHLLPVFKGIFHYNHGPRIHEYLSEFRRDVLSRYDCMTLAEAPLVSPRTALQYIQEGPGKEIDMMIQFQSQCADCLFTDYLPTRFSLIRLKRAFRMWQHALEGRGWNMLYLENHDHPRILPRYGSEVFAAESGKLLATAYLFLKGTPFVYQGQEIGMRNWHPEDAELYEDVQSRWHYRNRDQRKTPEQRLHILWRSSRDSARTPVQWSNEANAGFSAAVPWFSVNENHHEINIAAQEDDPDSILNYYRKAIALRKQLRCLKDGIYREYGILNPRHYVYTITGSDQTILVVCAFCDHPTRFRAPGGLDMEKAQLLLCNYPAGKLAVLRPWEARVYLWNRMSE